MARLRRERNEQRRPPASRFTWLALLEGVILIAMLVLAGIVHGWTGFIWGLFAVIVVENLRALAKAKAATERLHAATARLEVKLAELDKR